MADVSEVSINYDTFTKTTYTVATLPTASGQTGNILWVTDLNEANYANVGHTATGGGTYRGEVISNGSAWKLYGPDV